MNQRNLSLDLLRIIAMLLVLIVHVIGVIGVPTAESFNDDLLGSIGRSFLYFISVGCVDIFILLSGWFGLKFTLNKLANLFFQVIFWNVVSAIIYTVVNKGFSRVNIADILSLSDSLWFFLSYLCLYILSPILNSFVENAKRYDLRRVVFFFFFFQTIWCWVFESASFFMQGYSPLSFMGLYLLARYTRLYPSRWFSLHYKYDILIYTLLGAMTVAVVTVVALNGKFISRLFSYISPMIILSCLYLLLFFTKIKLSCGKNLILFLAPSAFTVYVFHANALIYPYFAEIVRFIYTNSNILFLFSFLIVLFAVVATVDRIRIYTWYIVTKKIGSK